MKVSVAMATYNGEKYIEEQLRSILEQTRPVDEVVICDDGSSDGTAAVVRDFIDTHDLKNWNFFENEHNLGYSENFRKAMDKLGSVGGEDRLIFLADQDDYWVKDRVEQMACQMERHPEIALLNTRQQTFCSGEEPWRAPSAGGDFGQPTPMKLTPHTRFLRSLGCEMVVRQSFYERVKPHWYTGWAHDEFLWSMALLGGSCYEWAYVSLYRRLHEKQVSGHLGHETQKRIQYLEGVRQSSEYLLRVSEEEGAPNDVCRLFRKNVRAHQLRLELIQKRKRLAALRLLPYLRYYYAPKSYLVELAMALKGTI